MMNKRRGICANYGFCPVADQGLSVIVSKTHDFVCHICDSALMDEPMVKTTSRPSRPVIMALAILIVGLLALWHFKPSPATPNASGAAIQKTNVMLRFAGSNTIGSELLPALAEAYMKQQGITHVKQIRHTDTGEVSLIDADNPAAATTIEIASQGSSTAFKELAAHTADIGIASRPIRIGEISKLAKLGDRVTPTTEHVLALDGIAIVVHPGNPLISLSKEQIAAIFSGVITDWSELGRAPGPINLYARNNRSGTYDTFKSVVLENLTISHKASFFEDSAILSVHVAADPNGIGFVGLPFVKKTKALAVSERGTSPLYPDRLSIATEDYPLTRRLYLYTPNLPRNPHVARFVKFALSQTGQEIVRQHDSVDLALQTGQPQRHHDAPPDYVVQTANAQRLSMNFRFLHGSHQLDSKALRDLDRVIDYLERFPGKKPSVMLFGFSDAVGDRSINQKLSHDRARTVADELAKRGVPLLRVTGYGSEMPVASNLNREGRERNRRVEIWIQR